MLSQTTLRGPLLHMTSFSLISYRVSSVRSLPTDQCYDYSSSGLRCCAEGRETFPGCGLFSVERGALKKSSQICACVFLEESLTVQSCEFINLTALHRPSPVCFLLRSWLRAVTSAGAGQAHTVLLVLHEDTPVVKPHLRKCTLHHISGNTLLLCFSLAVVLLEDMLRVALFFFSLANTVEFHTA